MGGGWGCPHEIDDKCSKINNLPCDPGMKGCVLAGRYRFANEDKNDRWHQKRVDQTANPPGDSGDEASTT